MLPWSDAASLIDRLIAKGFTEAAARRYAATYVSCTDALPDSDGGVRAWWVPGRIEVLGKHTDYAGGRSLLCATDLGATFVVHPRADEIVTILDLRSGEEDRFAMDADLQTTTGDWTNYPRTAARRLTRNFGAMTGADIVFKSTLPLAAGLSSSSALIVAFSTILLAINNLEDHPSYLSNITDLESRAGYLGTVENGQTFGALEGDAGVGTFGGSEDHTAILCSSPQMLKQYAFCPVRHESTVPFSESHVFVIASSGVVAEKTGAARERFNRASSLASETARVLGDKRGVTYPHLHAALQEGTRRELRERLASSSSEHFTGQDFVDRFDQFTTESEDIIPTASAALGSGDLGGFGKEVTRSQKTGAELLKNQVPQTLWLADRALELGALTASAFGAGFGGSVYAIAERVRAEDFRDEWEKAYIDQFPELADASTFVCTEPGPAAFEIS
jgi:galactokinase